jgi:hypothetical protein
MKDIKDVVCWLEEEIEHYKDYLDVKYSYLSDIEGRWEICHELLNWIKETPKNNNVVSFNKTVNDKQIGER